jgi:hypothetical protein
VRRVNPHNGGEVMPGSTVRRFIWEHAGGFYFLAELDAHRSLSEAQALKSAKNAAQHVSNTSTSNNPNSV